LPVSNAAETWRAKRGQTAHWVLAIPLGQARSRTALGVKGAGEGGIIPVGGLIANAVAGALNGIGV